MHGGHRDRGPLLGKRPAGNHRIRREIWDILRLHCRNILGPEDTEECVSDTWFRAWNAMPPQRPSLLSAFFGRITRNLAFDRYRSQSAAKRGRMETALMLEELGDCVSGRDNPEQRLDEKELAADLNAFLRSPCWTTSRKVMIRLE